MSKAFAPLPSPLRNSPIELRHLHAFAAVLAERHFGRAADRLGIAQPLLSMRVRSLESLIGEQLLIRRPKVAPTAAGEALHPFALEAIRVMEDGIAAGLNAARGVTGRFSIAFPSWMITSFVPEVINAFRHEHPGVDLILASMRSIDQIERIPSRRIDLGFLRNPVLDGDDFEPLLLLHDPWLLAVPASDPRASLTSVSLDCIAGDTLLIPDQHALNVGSDILDLIARGGGSPAHVQEFGIWLTALGLIAVDAGIELVPASQRSLWKKGIAYIPVEDAPSSRVCAIWRRGDDGPLIRAFLALLHARVAKPAS